MAVSSGGLDFAPALSSSLVAVLRSDPFGYTEVTVPEDGSLPAVTLGQLVLDTIGKRDADDVLIVHVISHGHAAEGNTAAVYVVGSDGNHDAVTNVATWLDKVRTRGAAAPQTLLLLDFCYSGNAPAVEAMLRDPALPPRAWLVCASQPADLAYDGRLTRAVTGVLEHIGEVGLAKGSHQFVPLTDVTRLIRRAVDDLSAGTGAAQQTTASFFDISAPPVVGRFFPNRYYDEAEAELQRERDALRQYAGPGVAPFVDRLFDAAHFVSRAQGRGPGVPFDASGYFYGRRSQLERLSDWALRGKGSSFQVVTGSPGAGKSALLGMLVCGVHPRLSLHTEQLRARYGNVLDAAVDALAAVHARQRHATDILASVANQLGFPHSDEPWTAQALAAGLRQLTEPPVIVIDALDEAVNLGELVDMLMTVAAAVRSDGTPADRLLVGTRARPEVAPLLDIARSAGDGPINLDDADPAELRRDLTDYVDALLASRALYRPAQAAAVRHALARRMAEALTSQPKGVHEWGVFLVALLTANHLSGLGQLPDPAVLDLPVDLPGVFEQDITASYYTEWLRPVLTTIAYAFRDGMPAQVIRIVASAFHPEGKTPTEYDVEVALRDARFYLRQGVDDDDAILFRLFHQGLADHLREGQTGGHGAIVDLVLAYVALRSGGWERLTPYLLRDIVDHARLGDRLDALAISPGFLVNASSRWLSPVLTYQSPYAQACAGVYMASFSRHRVLEPALRRHVLAIDAARKDIRQLADELAEPLPWRPRWATGDDLALAPRVLASEVSVPAIACSRLPDDTLVAVTVGQDVRVWDLGAGRPLLPPLTGSTGWVHAVACTALRDGTPVAVTAGNEVCCWNLDDGTQCWPPLGAPDGWVGAVACTTLADGTPIAITSGAHRVVRAWNLETRQPLGKPLTGHDGWVGAVACTTLADGTLIALTGGDDGTVRMWNLETGEAHGEPFTGHRGWVRTVACSTLPDDTHIALTAGNDFTVLVWNLDLARSHREPLIGHVSWINAMTCATVAGGLPIAVTCSEDRTIRVWDVSAQTLPRPSGPAINRVVLGDLDHGAHVAIAVAAGTYRAWNAATGEPRSLTGADVSGLTKAQPVPLRTGPTVTVTGGNTVQVNDAATGLPYLRPLTGHTGVARVACTVLDDGTPVAVIAGDADRVARIWDLETGQSLGEPLAGHTADIAALACGTWRDRTPIAVTSGTDGTLLVWDLTRREPLHSVALPAPADALAVDRDSTVFAALGRDIVALEFG